MITFPHIRKDIEAPIMSFGVGPHAIDAMDVIDLAHWSLMVSRSPSLIFFGIVPRTILERVKIRDMAIPMNNKNV